MTHLLLALIYPAFISLGLPDSLLGAVWPTVHLEFGVPLSYYPMQDRSPPLSAARLSASGALVYGDNAPPHGPKNRKVNKNPVAMPRDFFIPRSLFYTGSNR